MIEKVLELCKASLGYTEGPNNDTTFGKWFGLNNHLPNVVSLLGPSV